MNRRGRKAAGKEAAKKGEKAAGKEREREERLEKRREIKRLAEERILEECKNVEEDERPAAAPVPAEAGPSEEERQAGEKAEAERPEQEVAAADAQRQGQERFTAKPKQPSLVDKRQEQERLATEEAARRKAEEQHQSISDINEGGSDTPTAAAASVSAAAGEGATAISGSLDTQTISDDHEGGSDGQPAEEGQGAVGSPIVQGATEEAARRKAEEQHQSISDINENRGSIYVCHISCKFGCAYSAVVRSSRFMFVTYLARQP